MLKPLTGIPYTVKELVISFVYNFHDVDVDVDVEVM